MIPTGCTSRRVEVSTDSRSWRVCRSKADSPEVKMDMKNSWVVEGLIRLDAAGQTVESDC